MRLYKSSQLNPSSAYIDTSTEQFAWWYRKTPQPPCVACCPQAIIKFASRNSGWCYLPVKPALQSEGFAVRVPVRVHNVTALQHRCGQVQFSVLVRCLHKHFCETSAVPCRSNKLCVLTPMHSYFQQMRAQIEQCAWPFQAGHAQKGLIKHIVQPEQCRVQPMKLVLKSHH